MKYNLIVDFGPEQNQEHVSCEESQTRHIKQYMLDNLPSKIHQQVLNTHRNATNLYRKSNHWMQLLDLAAENEHCCSHYNNKAKRNRSVKPCTSTNNNESSWKSKTRKPLQTCIDNEIKKVEDLLRGPAVLRHPHLYPHQLNLTNKFHNPKPNFNSKTNKSNSYLNKLKRIQYKRERRVDIWIMLCITTATTATRA